MDEFEPGGPPTENIVSGPIGSPIEAGRANPLPTALNGADLQTLPHHLDAEMAFLGAILLDNNCLSNLSLPLTAAHFYDPVHVTIFAEASSMITAGRLADAITLQAKFAASGLLADLGGAAFLGRLVLAACDPIAVLDYAKLIYDLALRRDLIQLGGNIRTRAEMGPDQGKDAQSLIEEAESQLFKLAETGQTSSGFKTFNTSLGEFVATAQAAFERDGALVGISTGLRDLDNKLGGLHPSDLLILAGRPSMGKTALATNIAFNVAKTNTKVGFFSLEMSASQLTGRLLSDHVSIPSDQIRRGQISKAEYQKLLEAAAELAEVPLHIDETGGISIAALSARARRLKRTAGLDLLIIDYLQLITSSGARRSDSRVQEVSEITQGLKALAKDLNIPIIALSQLSRQVENRDNKRPQLADLRESGSIEQDADSVMFVYRHAYYLERQEPDVGTPEHLAWQEKMSAIQNVAEVIVGKQRHGPIGTVALGFEPQFTRFSDLDHAYDAGYDGE